MKCPACDNPLKEYDAGSVVIDICDTGCSGIWFDAGELEEVDESAEPFPAELLRANKNSKVVLDHYKPRPCPRCSNSLLSRRLYDPASEIELDECLQCAGLWLDIGELELLRDENEQRDMRATVLREFNTQADADSAGRVRAIIRLLFCES